MSVKTYNKLVRDNIPDIIEQTGSSCITKTLCDSEYLEMIDKKLNEELCEYYSDHSVEELADLLEVVYAAAKARGCTEVELNKLRNDKAAKRGAFDKKILLVSVSDGE